MLDSIYVMKNTLKSHFWSGVKQYDFVIMYATFPVNLKNTSGLSILLHGIISLHDATSYDKNNYANALLTRRMLAQGCFKDIPFVFGGCDCQHGSFILADIFSSRPWYTLVVQFVAQVMVPIICIAR